MHSLKHLVTLPCGAGMLHVGVCPFPLLPCKHREHQRVSCPLNQLLSSQTYVQCFQCQGIALLSYLHPLLVAETILITSPLFSLWLAPILCFVLASTAYRKPFAKSACTVSARSLAVDPSGNSLTSGRTFPFLSVNLNSSSTG